MKGVIACCLSELVIKQFGNEKWQNILKSSGFSHNTVFLATQDIPDSDIIKLIESVTKVLNISSQQIADAFGEYWVNIYAAKIFKSYYRRWTSAREFLLEMDNIHLLTTKNVPNAHPPRFEYQWKDSKTLLMTYKSNRGLIDILIGLVKGVGKYFQENISVIKLGPDKIQIQFKESN